MRRRHLVASKLGSEALFDSRLGEEHSRNVQNADVGARASRTRLHYADTRISCPLEVHKTEFSKRFWRLAVFSVCVLCQSRFESARPTGHLRFFYDVFESMRVKEYRIAFSARYRVFKLVRRSCSTRLENLFLLQVPAHCFLLLCPKHITLSLRKSAAPSSRGTTSPWCAPSRRPPGGAKTSRPMRRKRRSAALGGQF